MSSPEMMRWAEKWAERAETENDYHNDGEPKEKYPMELQAEKYQELKERLHENPNQSLSEELDAAWSEYSQGKMSDEEIQAVFEEIEQEIQIQEVPPDSPNDEAPEVQETSIGRDHTTVASVEVSGSSDGHTVDFDPFEFIAQGLEHINL